MKALGKPLKIDESHSGVGDDYTFRYPGMNIYFSNVSSDVLKLTLIEFNNESTSYLQLKDSKNRIATHSDIKKQFDKTNIEQF